MSIIYNDTSEKSDLQRRIAAELRAKQEAKSKNEPQMKLSGFDDGAKTGAKSRHTVNDEDDAVQRRARLWVGALFAAVVAIVAMLAITK